MRTFYRSIIFTKTPLKGKFRYKDIFQVYPINLDNYPKNIHAEHIPCLIEYWVDREEIQAVNDKDFETINEFLADTTTQTNKLTLITNLLSTITNFRFFFNRHMEGFWGVELPEKKFSDADNQKSKWNLNLFSYPEMSNELGITDFSTPAFPDIEFVSRNLYYYYNPIEDRKSYIRFPADCKQTLNGYFNLKPNEKIVCDSAIFQLCNGLDLYSKMRSLSFLSVISSIETLVNFEFKDEILEFECQQCKTLRNSSRNCKKCGRPIWGITAKFRDFLFKFVSNEPKAKKMYNELYNLRSKIAHTEFLITNDNILDWNLNSKSFELRVKQLEAIQTARRAISSWLQKDL